MHRYRCRMVFLAIFALAAHVLLLPKAISAKPGKVRIAIVTSHNAKQYEVTLEGFMHCLKEKKIEYEFDVYLMEGDPKRGKTVAKELAEKKPSIIFTIGSLATVTVVKKIAEIPVISGVVLKGADLRKNPNGTGVFLEFPLKIQLKKLRTILPDAKNIGVLYNPEENKAKIEEARKVAGELGLHLYAEKVYLPQDIPSALSRLEKRADVMWAIPDKLVLNPQTAKHLLLFSFRNRIPFVGLSPAWVKAGALYSLDWDYYDIGVQCGEMALKVIQGVPAKSVKSSHPRKVLYSLNMKTARSLKVDISEDILQGAHTVYWGGK